MSDPGPILSRPVGVSEIHGQREVEVVADPRERKALAAEYDLLDLADLTGRLTLTALPDGAVGVSGRVVANVVQACVVSLVPVKQHIDETIALRFVKPGSPELTDLLRPQAEIVVDPAAPDPPEVITGGSIDVGQVVEEALVLALDPYPRAPGAELPAEAEAEEGKKPSPFAALAALKRPPR